MLQESDFDMKKIVYPGLGTRKVVRLYLKNPILQLYIPSLLITSNGGTNFFGSGLPECGTIMTILPS